MTALDTQVGGTHYKDFAIQPAEFCHKNGIGFLEGNVIKYVCRHNSKGGRQDLEKALHYIQLLLDLEYPGADKPATFAETEAALATATYAVSTVPRCPICESRAKVKSSDYFPGSWCCSAGHVVFHFNANGVGV